MTSPASLNFLRGTWPTPLLASLGVLILSGCAGLPRPGATPLPAAPALASLAPAQWQSPLPHGGDAQALSRWWQRFDDPLLAPLISDAQRESPTLAAATSRIAQAQAARVAAGAALGPQLDATAAASRGRQLLSTPISTTLSAGVQASWELDLFGGQAAARDAAQARLEGAQADWHDARVAVAAEVANSYIGLRTCEAVVLQNERDAGSRAETARLTALSAQAGFQAPADAALARASAAQARSTLLAQQASCAIELKALVALTGVAEPALRSRLSASTARLPQPTEAGVGPSGSAASVPAQALAQRPDLLSAERALVAAAADVSQSDAQRFPRIALSGNIAAARSSAAGFSSSGTVWSLGPLQLSLPLFDGGARRANVEAARARYDEAAASYRGRLRTAVREVEEALVRLQSAADRAGDVSTAAEGFEQALRAAEARYKGGLASLFELEDARRSAVAAQAGLVALQRERSLAWVQLYRALGGGWSADELPQRLGGAAAPAALTASAVAR